MSNERRYSDEDIFHHQQLCDEILNLDDTHDEHEQATIKIIDQLKLDNEYLVKSRNELGEIAEKAEADNAKLRAELEYAEEQHDLECRSHETTGTRLMHLRARLAALAEEYEIGAGEFSATVEKAPHDQNERDKFRIMASCSEAFANRVRAVLAEAPGTISVHGDIQKLINEQAEDPGLWFIATTAAEAYLQAALRKLHEAIEKSAPTEACKLACDAQADAPEPISHTLGQLYGQAEYEK